MTEWYIGENGTGKTVLLEEILDREIEKGFKVITNLRNIKYDGFDEDRINLIRNYDDFNLLFDYHEIKVNSNDRMEVVDSEIKYTDSFINLLTLLCRKGDVLILDEPEFMLYGIEISSMVELFEILKESYKKAFIATHCQELLDFEDDCYYLLHDYKQYKLEEDQIFKCIGQF